MMSADIDAEVDDFMAGLTMGNGQDDEAEAAGNAEAVSASALAHDKAAARASVQRRQESRQRVNWRVALLCNSGDGERTYYGKAQDISLDGMSILSTVNIHHQGLARLLLEIPTHGSCGSDTFIEVQTKPIYSVLSGGQFQIGLQFMSFVNGSKSILEMHLNKLH